MNQVHQSKIALRVVMQMRPVLLLTIVQMDTVMHTSRILLLTMLDKVMLQPKTGNVTHKLQPQRVHQAMRGKAQMAGVSDQQTMILKARI
jgi:hypothetical protein